ncbi:MAG: hypothetical protein Alpg2KO_14690 [Alphaproteobacteria bacterium]
MIYVDWRVRRRGVSLVSYGLLVGLIGVIALLAITGIGNNVTSLMTSTADSMSTAAGGAGAGVAAGSGGSCSAAKQVITFTGSSQSITVPAGCTQLNAKLWGAGGGPSGACQNCGSSGAGGFTNAVIPVSEGQQLTIVAGGAGLPAQSGLTPGSFPGGGDGYNSGSGGGYSGIFSGTGLIHANALAIAGAGGGNAVANISQGDPNGGGLSGGAGHADNNCGNDSKAGTQSGGGDPLQGLGPESPSPNGPGGGGGYYGGKGPTGTGNFRSFCKAGGGSGYLNSGAGVTGTTEKGVHNTVDTTANQPPGMADPDYQPGIALGGEQALNDGNTDLPGNGLVVLIWQ